MQTAVLFVTSLSLIVVNVLKVIKNALDKKIDFSKNIFTKI